MLKKNPIYFKVLTFLSPFIYVTMVTVSKKVKEVCADLVLTDPELRKVMGLMHEEICKGLTQDTNATADVRCYPTYVRNIPNGSEKGKFLALDLGGTNFRVLLIELGGSQKNKMLSKIFAVPQSIMLGSGQGLFDHIADCLAVFMKEHGVQLERLPLGFTFSFPCMQEGLTKGRLVRWTKGFNCSGVEGEDVVKLLQAAIRRRGDVDIDVLAVLNDTTGTLMSCAHKNPECRVGIIIGTGTNACYLERLGNVELWDGDFNEPQQVIINTEWGNFGKNGCLDFILTEYDKEIDEKSLNPGEQVFEKMISGMYMGELARLVISRLVRQGILFRGQASEVLFKKGSFYTKYISEIER